MMKSERITEVDELSQSINVKYKSQKNSGQKTLSFYLLQRKWEKKYPNLLLSFS